MKLTLTIKLLFFSLWATVIQAAEYTLIDLGTLGGSSTFANGINENNQITGYSDTGSEAHAFIWENGTFTDLGTLGGNESIGVGINNNGDVAGYSRYTSSSIVYHATVWDSTGINDLDPTGGVDSYATDINDNGTVIGIARKTIHPVVAVWNESGIHFPDGVGTSSSSAKDINNSGQIVGSYAVSGSGSRAFVGDINGLSDLGTLCTDGGTNCGALASANAINENGTIVGTSQFAAGNSRRHAFMGTQGNLIDLGTLSGDVPNVNSISLAINNNGVVVGESQTLSSNNYRAFIWDDTNGMRDLNDLVDDLGAFNYLSLATGINDSGVITGWGYTDANSTIVRAFILIPNVEHIPVADAGPDQSVFVGDLVTLDASQSTDGDGDPLTYSWSLTSTPMGSSATLSDVNAINPTFSVDLPGVYTASLIVNDGTSDSTADTVVISTINVAPVANAGSDDSAFVGDTVTLDGSASNDADGDQITYSWSFSSKPANSNATLDDPTNITPSFVIDQPGSYTIDLVVNDGTENSEVDQVSISTINVPPVANAGSDQAVFVGNTVTLDGSQSFDADGDALIYRWSFTSIPEGSTAAFDDFTAVNPSFTIDVAGIYIVSLLVFDPGGNGATDTVSISTINVAPIANAGPDQSVYLDDIVTLDASLSSDADGDLLNYNWSFVSTPTASTATLDDPSAISPTFDVDAPGVYIVQLIVNDGALNSAPDTVSINTLNVAPIANAGPDQSVNLNSTVTLDASQSSDADGDTLTYSWNFTSKPASSNATLDDANSVSPTFTADVSGTYTLSLVVNDATVDSTADTITISTINAAPVAESGPNQSVLVGESVFLDGSQSSDPDNDNLSFSWSFATKPVGSNANLDDATLPTPTFTADLAGLYTLNLIVNDGILNSEPDSVMITAVSVITTAISQLENLMLTVEGLDQSAFKKKKHRKKLTKRIGKIIHNLEKGKINKAIKKLQKNILRRTDGCELTGSPHKKDWIVDCTAQADVYSQVIAIIELLQAN